MDTWSFFSTCLVSLWLHRLYVYSAVAFGISIWIIIQFSTSKHQKKGEKPTGNPNSSEGVEDKLVNGCATLQAKEVYVAGVKIFYGSQTGTAKRFARALAEAVISLNVPVEVISIGDYDPDDCLLEETTSRNICVFLVATYTDGQPTESAAWFCRWLEEAANDFRFEKTYLKGLRYAVFGLGNSVYVDHYNTAEALFDTSSEAEADAEEAGGTNSVVDVEDLGNIMRHMKQAKRERELEEGDVGMSLTRENAGRKEEGGKREMITPALREALTKQGYKLIGSHSGVKLCRWTKSMLRGRGGCYKHTFYGIESHRCMEATPSLACANKCVFCWRHHTNPVGTEWRWKMDQPEMILQQAIENHQNMIKQFKGVAGVQAARFEEAMTAKHCALSLVGEPIMYPEINRFVRLLHQHSISTFLVTNAQFPDEIRNLEPVTQLYVSVDASTKESLKRIDRPLFKDFWQRFLDSLKALSEKQQRTVYRLTLVKAWNVDELKAYADLISLGKPDFIEVKGVTYCGKSSASNLTMANVPWHEEVVHFVQELANLIPHYEIACEHEHSNCLLIAHKKFKINGEWCTWINYDRFQELVRAQEQSGGSQTFTGADYAARTPHWALFGSRERGFDPLDVKYQRKNKARDISGC
ncbi:S-adenosyl-L-methionine-dependent tRNA 4-demethylwyosine synthase TYW1-like isoform X3 [Strigops habroptila]|uniref:S-adenosyl-L-methionine-dependent tRNA 4-demethylwyosine synthase TYW1-like isoform X3 n=1 Tax=Strigops habroptila TaxID=2489341 RepID=UPI0011CF1AB7|nr:S-adenosyl-L-methionine-dependent tRNA 4-demethylwyosine synthase TYW1-like isoform X3 [Strigops habroptila]